MWNPNLILAFVSCVIGAVFFILSVAACLYVIKSAFGLSCIF